MKVEKEVEGGLQDRQELVQIMDGAADFLASRDTEANSRARARWKLWSGPRGEVWIGLQLDDEGYSLARTFSPTQLTDDNRDLRLVMMWNDVLSQRTLRQFEHVNKLIRQYQEN